MGKEGKEGKRERQRGREKGGRGREIETYKGGEKK